MCRETLPKNTFLEERHRTSNKEIFRISKEKNDRITKELLDAEVKIIKEKMYGYDYFSCKKKYQIEK